jgi:hypothetical protein
MNESMLKEYPPEYDDFMVEIVYYMEKHNCSREQAIIEVSNLRRT